MNKLLFLGLGSVLGGFARYFMSDSFFKTLGTSYPYGTLIVNLLGCLMIGFVTSLSKDKYLIGSDMHILLIVGFCGAFTTFSTFMLETNSLIQYGQFFKALGYILTSCIAGFMALRLGAFLAKLV